MEKPFIGKMDRKIQVVLIEKQRDEVGGVTTVPTVICNPYSFMKELSGNEDPEGKIRHIVNRTYTIRYNAQVLQHNTKLKVIDGENVLDVYHVKEIGRKSHLEILVTENE